MLITPCVLFFLKFCLGTCLLFEELARHAGGDGSQECHNCGSSEELVDCALLMCIKQFLKTNYLVYLKQMFLLNVLETFMHFRVFYICSLIVEKKVWIVNNYFRSWYNRVGFIHVSVGMMKGNFVW